jgi:four helix bundle protein
MKGSVYEVVSLLYVMRARGYVVHESFDILYAQCDEIARMLSGIMRR